MFVYRERERQRERDGEFVERETVCRYRESVCL